MRNILLWQMGSDTFAREFLFWMLLGGRRGGNSIMVTHFLNDGKLGLGDIWCERRTYWHLGSDTWPVVSVVDVARGRRCVGNPIKRPTALDYGYF